MNVPVSCNKDCGAGCPLTATVENGRITSIRDSSEKGEWMSGCARGYGSHRVLNHPERLLSPMIKDRKTGVHRASGWEEAIDYAAGRLSSIRDRFGAAAVMRLGGSGSCRGALHNTSTLARRFLSCFGGYTETTGSYSSAAVSFVTPFVYGTSNAAVDAGSLMNSRFVLLQGANIADLRFGCELLNRLKHLRSRGVRIIVVDPRKSRTVTELDAEWIRINPGTDSAFIAAVIYDLIEDGGIDYEYIDRYCSGFEDYRGWLQAEPEKSPAWAARICGCEAEEIRRVADCYRRYKPAALIPGLSIQRNMGGEDAARSAMVLQSVTGNTGIAGGTSGANIWGPSEPVRCGKLSAAPARGSEDSAPQMRYVPVYSWPDLILSAAEDVFESGDAVLPPVKAVYNCGGNYLVQGADTNKSINAFELLDFSVTHDLFMTPTALASDVVFPVSDYLERNDIVFPEGNFLLYSARAVPPPEGIKSDYEVFCLLAERMGFRKRFSEGRDEAAWLEYFLSNSEVDDSGLFKNRGIFFGQCDNRVALSGFIADPGGCPLSTPSGKIEISSSRYAELGASPFPVYIPQRLTRKFRLITPHRRERINSQTVGKKMEEPPRLMINSADAQTLGLSDGERVRIFNEFGETLAAVHVTTEIISGTTSLDCSRSNMLTSTLPSLPSGGSRTHTTFVDIEPA